ERFHVARIDLKAGADALQQLPFAPHLEIGAHEVRCKLQVANAGQADGELLFLGVENELLFFSLSRGRDHVGSTSDGSGLTRDAAIGFALAVFPDGDAPNPVRFPRNTRDLQRCAVEVDLPSVEI